VSLTDSVQQLISLFRSLCITFGKPYSDKKVRIEYKKNIKERSCKRMNACYFHFHARVVLKRISTILIDCFLAKLTVIC